MVVVLRERAAKAMADWQSLFSKWRICMKKEEFDNKKKLVYDFVTDKEYKPMSVKEMAMVLQVPAA